MESLAVTAEAIPLRTDEGGVVRVGGTRVTLDSVISVFEEGATAEGILDEYPSLSLADVYAVITYYLRHKTDVDAYLEEQKRRAQVTRRQDEARYDRAEIRERLLARESQR
jgi:uncharacterized protein (DUF433 family)